MTFQLLERRERRLGVVAATVASASVFAGLLSLFAGSGQTPWFAADSELAALAARCDHAPTTAARHACLRDVAAMPTRLAAASAPALAPPPQPPQP